MSNTQAVNETLIRSRPYSLLRDFVPMPAAIVARLNAEVLKIVRKPDARARAPRQWK